MSADASTLPAAQVAAVASSIAAVLSSSARPPVRSRQRRRRPATTKPSGDTVPVIQMASRMDSVGPMYPVLGGQGGGSAAASSSLWLSQPRPVCSTLLQKSTTTSGLTATTTPNGCSPLQRRDDGLPFLLPLSNDRKRILMSTTVSQNLVSFMPNTAMTSYTSGPPPSKRPLLETQVATPSNPAAAIISSIQQPATSGLPSTTSVAGIPRCVVLRDGATRIFYGNGSAAEDGEIFLTGSGAEVCGGQSAGDIVLLVAAPGGGKPIAASSLGGVGVMPEQARRFVYYTSAPMDSGSLKKPTLASVGGDNNNTIVVAATKNAGGGIVDSAAAWMASRQPADVVAVSSSLSATRTTLAVSSTSNITNYPLAQSLAAIQTLTTPKTEPIDSTATDSGRSNSRPGSRSAAISLVASGEIRSSTAAASPAEAEVVAQVEVATTMITGSNNGIAKTFLCTECFREFTSEKYLSMHVSLHQGAAVSAYLGSLIDALPVGGETSADAISISGDYVETAGLHVSSAQAAGPVTVTNPSSSTSTTLIQLPVAAAQTLLLTSPPPPIRRAKSSSNSSAQWTCQICEKTFAQNSNYKNHIRTHSNERPFVCEICSIGFKERYHLKKHVLFKHTDELREECQVCGKRFKDSTAVRAHERTHSDLRPYACPRCDKTFKTSECLWHHENRSKTCGKSQGELPAHCLPLPARPPRRSRQAGAAARKAAAANAAAAAVPNNSTANFAVEKTADVSSADIEELVKFISQAQQPQQQLGLSATPNTAMLQHPQPGSPFYVDGSAAASSLLSRQPHHQTAGNLTPTAADQAAVSPNQPDGSVNSAAEMNAGSFFNLVVSNGGAAAAEFGSAGMWYVRSDNPHLQHQVATCSGSLQLPTPTMSAASAAIVKVEAEMMDLLDDYNLAAFNPPSDSLSSYEVFDELTAIDGVEAAAAALDEDGELLDGEEDDDGEDYFDGDEMDAAYDPASELDTAAGIRFSTGNDESVRIGDHQFNNQSLFKSPDVTSVTSSGTSSPNVRRHCLCDQQFSPEEAGEERHVISGQRGSSTTLLTVEAPPPGARRPYRCELCHAGFKLKVHLKKHNLYKHSDSYPCQCGVCGKPFKDSSAVRLHERIHSSDRPFECASCGKRFKTRENLWGHRHRGPCDRFEPFAESASPVGVDFNELDCCVAAGVDGESSSAIVVGWPSVCASMEEVRTTPTGTGSRAPRASTSTSASGVLPTAVVAPIKRELPDQIQTSRNNVAVAVQTVAATLSTEKYSLPPFETLVTPHRAQPTDQTLPISSASDEKFPPGQQQYLMVSDRSSSSVVRLPGIHQLFQQQQQQQRAMCVGGFESSTSVQFRADVVSSPSTTASSVGDIAAVVDAHRAWLQSHQHQPQQQLQQQPTFLATRQPCTANKQQTEQFLIVNYGSMADAGSCFDEFSNLPPPPPYPGLNHSTGNIPSTSAASHHHLQQQQQPQYYSFNPILSYSSSDTVGQFDFDELMVNPRRTSSPGSGDSGSPEGVSCNGFGFSSQQQIRSSTIQRQLNDADECFRTPLCYFQLPNCSKFAEF